MKLHIQNTTQGKDVKLTLTTHELTCLVYAVLAHWRERSNKELVYSIAQSTKQGVDIVNIALKQD